MAIAALKRPLPLICTPIPHIGSRCPPWPQMRISEFGAHKRPRRNAHVWTAAEPALSEVEGAVQLSQARQLPSHPVI